MARDDDTQPAPEGGATRYSAPSLPEESDPRVAGVPEVGAVIAGKYRVERVIGVGGMGVVVAVTHTQLGEAYAMKFLLPRGAADPETIARFRREAQAAVRIKSEHIARVSDFGELENGAPYILMEHLTGLDLGNVLEAHGRLPVRDAVEYVLQACAGIAEAHALGIVHRDLKPSNLFLTQRLDGAPLVKVLDFGISKAMTRDVGPASPSLTQTTSVFGSPAYMSPEQLRSAKNVDFRADVWGLGIILFELLAGVTPFRGETGSGLLAAIAADPPDSLRGHRDDVPEELEAVVFKCLEKDVRKRFQSVSELAVALAPFRSERSTVSIGRIVRLSGAPAAPLPELASSTGPGISSRDVLAVGSATDGPVTTGGRVREAKRNRSLLFLGLVAVAAALGVGGLYAARYSKTKGEAVTAVAPSETATSLPSAPATTIPIATNVTPSATSSATVAAPASAAATSRPGRATGKLRPGATAAPGANTTPATTTATATPTPTPKPETTRDPAADSH